MQVSLTGFKLIKLAMSMQDAQMVYKYVSAFENLLVFDKHL